MIYICGMAAWNPGSPKMPFPLRYLPQGVYSSSFFCGEPPVNTNRAATFKPALIKRESRGRTLYLYWFYPYLPRLQPKFYPVEIELPSISKFSRWASPKEPVINIPGPHVQLSCQVGSIHLSPFHGSNLYPTEFSLCFATGLGKNSGGIIFRVLSII